jgi:hypothetical protein
VVSVPAPRDDDRSADRLSRGHADERADRVGDWETVEMAEVQIFPVDERDSSWEIDTPRFRVYLHGSGETTAYGWTATYDITGADVLQVIDWAQRQAGDSLTYAVALVYDDKTREQVNAGDGRGLLWLVGTDGNTNAQSPEETAVLNRMLVRRRDPVGVPESDRIHEGALSVGKDLIARLNEAQPPP